MLPSSPPPNLLTRLLRPTSITRRRYHRLSEVPKLLHTRLIKSGDDRNPFPLNGLLNSYTKLGNFGYARILFDEMPEKNSISWTCLISAYDQHGFSTHACNLFCSMVSSGFAPTHYTFASMLHACRSWGHGLFLVGNGFHLVNDALGVFHDAPIMGEITVHGEGRSDGGVFGQHCTQMGV